MVSFKNAIIIMTSNLGSSEIYREAAALNAARLKQQGGGKVAAEAEGVEERSSKVARVREVVMEQVSWGTKGGG